MKLFLTTDIAGAGYTFNAASKTVTFTGTIPTFGQILAILNVTRNVIIYRPDRLATGGTFASPVLTLTYDTTAMSNSDVLEIIVDRPAAVSNSTVLTALDAVNGGNDFSSTIPGATVSPPTAGSFIAIKAANGESSWYCSFGTIVSSTTANGRLYFEGSVDSTTGSDGIWSWIPARRLDKTSELAFLSKFALEQFTGNVGKFKWIRVRLALPPGVSAAGSPSISTTLGLGHGPANIDFSGPIPTLVNQDVTISSSNTPATAQSLIPTSGYSTVGVNISNSGAFVGTLQFEAACDDTNFFPVAALLVTAGTTATSTTNPVSQWKIPCAGYKWVQVRCSAYTSGNCLLKLSAHAGEIVDFPLPAGNNNIGDVDVATLPALPAGNNNIGDVDVVTLPALPIGTNKIGTVDIATAPAVAKGTQGANGVPTQDLKDSGRVYCNFAGANPVTAVTTEALITLTPYRDLVAGGTGTSFAVTAGKRLRLQALIVTWRDNTAAAGGVTIRLRLLAGTVLVGSPVHASVNASTSLATVGSGVTALIMLPDGLELSGTMQLGLTQIAVGAVVGFDVNLIGFEY